MTCERSAGKSIFIRLVDESSDDWGHINFDHFRFHDKRPAIDNVAQVPKATRPGPKDEYPYAKLPAEKAAAVMKVPDGFSVKVFAAEPDVKQPIAMALDDRGRVWIAEAYEYPVAAPRATRAATGFSFLKTPMATAISTSGRSLPRGSIWSAGWRSASAACGSARRRI